MINFIKHLFKRNKRTKVRSLGEIPYPHKENASNGSFLTLNDYQWRAMETCMPTSRNILYMLGNLVGEVGEFSSKIAKKVRKTDCNKDCMKVGHYGTDKFFNENYGFALNPQEEADLKKEAGDILWQISGLCSIFGWTLEDVGRDNLAKLASRKNRGVIDGNGDNR